MIKILIFWKSILSIRKDLCNVSWQFEKAKFIHLFFFTELIFALQ